MNDGQTDSSVRYVARSRGSVFFFTPDEVIISSPTGNRSADVVRMHFAGASESARLIASDEEAWRSNYFSGGDPAGWHRDVANYARVTYTGIYPGIDVVYYGAGGLVEYDFVVQPGADPSRIALAFEGVAALRIDEAGNLRLETASGTLVQQKPILYQRSGSRRESVAGDYVIGADQRVGFVVGSYDTTRTLIIDPVLVYSTYLGGGANDFGRAIAIDGDGSSYITGETNSIDFPGVSAGAIQTTNTGGYDAFVTKLSSHGSARLYTTYLGGSHHDFGYAIAVDGAGNAYVTGETSSPTVAGAGNSPFPTMNALQANYGLGGDAFITKINAAGNGLVYSTYFGGTGVERGDGIAVDSAGNAYLTGHTNSVNLPVVNALQGLNGGSYDAFVLKINAAGNALVYSTYLGGNGSEYSTERGGIAIDAGGSAYIAGTTASTNFPGASSSTIQPVYGGDFNDGYVAKIADGGGSLVYSTFLGGSGREEVYGIALDGQNNVYVAGVTNSQDFPTAAALQPAKGAPLGNEAFVTKINAAGSALVYSTYLGGSAGDFAFDLGVDNAGNAYVAGSTDSVDFPMVSPLQASKSGVSDVFLSVINAAGSALAFSTYFGGAGGDLAYGIAVDPAGNARVTGSTSSTNFPTMAALQTAIGGSQDAFVLTIAGPGPATPQNLIATATSTVQIHISWSASAGAARYEVARNSGAGWLSALITGTSLVDTQVEGAKTYVYKVRALDSLSQPSLFSTPDAATTIFFSTDPLIVGSTVVRAAHIRELRQATNAMRTTAGLPTVFTDPFLDDMPIRVNHVEEIRYLLVEARATLELTAMGYTDALIAGSTPIRAVHLQELRTGVK